MFSACEYVIAVANILFHYTAVHEFGNASWCLLDYSHEAQYPYLHYSKDGGRANGPVHSRQMTSLTDYDNNERKKLS